MKDIDFDELDRAVNNLMGSVSGMSEPVKQDDTKTLTIAETLKDDKPPVMPVGEVKEPASVPATVVAAASEVSVTVEAPVAPAPAASPSGPTKPAERTPSLATRRSGKFMDMVRPGSTMKKPADAKPVSRQGVSLAPLAEDAAPAPSTLTPAAAPSVMPVPDDTAPAASTEESAWPDPLDIQPTAPVASESADDTAPLSTPFLADAKVEKRPLGSPVPPAETPDVALENETTASEPTEETAEVTDADAATAEPEVPATVLPEELQSDLMAIESDQATTLTPEPVAEPVEEPATEPAPVSETMANESDAPKDVAPVAVVAAATPMAVTTPVVTAGGSIPQQYQEQPSTGDQTIGAIYDTATYHQPLDHPVKKKSSWLWLVWVAILLILGAGGGAIAYLFLLQ